LSDQDPALEAANDAGQPPLAGALGGDVSTVFTYGRLEDYAAAIEDARLEQQAICGFPLRVLRVRQTHTKDIKNNDVYEVFASFGPVEDPQ
jgi:hypothetical protein